MQDLLSEPVNPVQSNTNLSIISRALEVYLAMSNICGDHIQQKKFRVSSRGASEPWTVVSEDQLDTQDTTFLPAGAMLEPIMLIQNYVITQLACADGAGKVSPSCKTGHSQMHEQAE